MGVEIRKALDKDAESWISILKEVIGDSYPFKKVYDSTWVSNLITGRLDNSENFFLLKDGKAIASISLLPPAVKNFNPVANIGRLIVSKESFDSDAVSALLDHVAAASLKQGHLVVSRVPASDFELQKIYEKTGFTCIGVQPYKHQLKTLETILFYIRFNPTVSISRLPISESLPEIRELSLSVLNLLKIANPPIIRDGATGYPLYQPDVVIKETTQEEFRAWTESVASKLYPTEVSSGYNIGHGYLRLPVNTPLIYFKIIRSNNTAAMAVVSNDELDKCIRIIDLVSVDDISPGALFSYIVEYGKKSGAQYLEIDVLMNATRLLKSLEQLGFVPVAYFPAFHFDKGRLYDVVKLVKLNRLYETQSFECTADSKKVVALIEKNFLDQKVGLAVVNLLGSLKIFKGLGDGELRKIASQFSQKLYKQGDKVFSKGDPGDEAYIIVRGKIGIYLEEKGQPIAELGPGMIFGEQAFLESVSRTATAVAMQPTILLVINRNSFNFIIQSEAHLGLVVLKNIAIDLSHKLRSANLMLIDR